ncbi:RNA-directed DNA polymerase (reversetranscriptase)-related family protein [Striga asiatica]|uniref:RNA-directed DNA polymerase (Reversetranscriptase)-related family protein n=1 Tax=Striga asiatica TaxID=4170 RepID=A0A5A7P448_STRAF|nr:RNA-directed DNA polymerase (reversetranscriptase)-related family protein [Striga asiatica]
MKAVLGALPTYSMSCFLLPQEVIRKISSTMANFWWNSNSNKAKSIHWKAWDKLTLPKKLGGLGFHDLNTFNRALITKQLWRLLTHPNLLVSKILKAKYFPKEDFFTAKKKSNSSWLWACWLKQRDSFKSGIRYSIRDGKRVKIWDHPWVPNLKGKKLQHRNTSGSRIVWAKDLMEDSGRRWNRALIEENFTEEEAKAIMEITGLDPHQKDRLVWDWSSTGKFSVASSYSTLILRKFLEQDSPEASQDQSALRKARMRTWRMKIKPKVKHFLWKGSICSSIAIEQNSFGSLHR